MTATLAGLFAACSVLAFPGRGARRRLESALPGVPAGSRWRPSASGPWHPLLPAIALGIVSALLARSTVLAFLVPLGAWRAHAAWSARTHRLTAERRRAEIIELCVTLCAELRAGREEREALAEAAKSSCPDLAGALAGPLATGDDIVPALRASARRPGREALGLLAACWQVAEGGAGMAAAVGELADGLRAGRRQRREVDAELAGIRASARLLCALPTLGLILGSGIGAAPVGILLHTGAGQSCLVLGLVLALGGLAWMNRIVRSAEVAL